MADLPDQTPAEEFTERVGETAAGAIVIPHLIAVDDYRRNQHAARKAVADTRRIMRHLNMQGAGMTEEQMQGRNGSSEEMGDIIYTGDIVCKPGTEIQLGKSRIKVEQDPNTPALPPPTTPPTNTTTTTTLIDRGRGRLRNFLLPALIGAATLGTGAAGMALYNYLTDKPEQQTTIQNPVQDWKLGLEVRDQP